METSLKSCLKAITLELRRELEGDLERRLGEIGVWRERPAKPADELAYRTSADRDARRVIDAYVKSHMEAGLDRERAIEELVREAAYTWANRLLALRCMEARGLIDEVILQKGSYGRRSLQHHRLAKRAPERCTGDDEGLFAVLYDEFERRAVELPLLFDPRAPEVALRPSVRAIKNCVAKLSGTDEPKGRAKATDDVFTAPDAAGWAYQYWNTEEKDRVFENARSPKRAKITGAAIIPATCIYTEPYMVKFLVQNSLGAMWIGMHPASRLCETWDYFVSDADRVPVGQRAVRDITFLDPACGSGHFLIEAFDLFFEMYREEGELRDLADICAAILEHNLFGIDIDERAVQIAAFALVMKAKEKAPDFVPRRVNLVATNIRLPATKEHLDAFLRKHPEDAQLKPALVAIFEALAHADELGSLLQLEEPVEKELRALQTKYEAAGSPGEQQALWAEYQKPVQGKLPIGVASYEAWKERALTRIREHFDADAQSSDLGAAFFGEAGAKGVSLVDVLSRRYDVVAANPPYMGSKNMGPVVKRHVDRHFTPGKRDLYAAFILRCRELVRPGGKVAMVTQQSWMFLRSYADLRAIEEEKRRKTRGAFTGVLREDSVEALAHLGPHAFAEIGGEVVNVALFVLARAAPSSEHQLTAFRLIGPKSAEEKDRLLREAIGWLIKPHAGAHPMVSQPLQSRFLSIPQAPLCYWLRDRFFELLCGDTLSNVATFTDGVAVRLRFVRFFWETTRSQRWVVYAKGGGYARWCGLEQYSFDWEPGGKRFRVWLLDKYPAEKLTLLLKEHARDRSWASWSDTTGGSLACRVVPPGTLIGHKGPAGTSNTLSAATLAAILNSRLSGSLARALNPSLSFTYRDMMRLPAPGPHDRVAECAMPCVSLKGHIVSRNPIERQFASSPHLAASLRESYEVATERWEAAAAVLHALEGLSERFVFAAYKLEAGEVAAVLDEMGRPVGWFPPIAGYDATPELGRGIEAHLPHALTSEPRRVAASELGDIKKRLQGLYEAGPGADHIEDDADPSSEEADDEETDVAGLGASIPVPTETLLEELSQKLELHPFSIYWLLRELRETDGITCQPELVRFVEDYTSVLVLRLLGHRWPRQLEFDEEVPEWVDRYGVIPLTEGTGELTLLARMRERLSANFGVERASAVEREFEEITGKMLASWLASDFFRRHISQFRKRPIAWQLTSLPYSSERRRGRRTARRTPAFSCLIYYHRVDGDLLPKLRSQYIGPLRARLQTELAGLEKLKERTHDQDTRRVELDAKLEELHAFDARLEDVIVSGFDCGHLEMLLANELLDKWTSRDGRAVPPASQESLLSQERRYDPDLNDGIRINIAPLQQAGILTEDVLAAKDVERAIADRAEWRADERRWCREGKLPQPGWWPVAVKPLKLPKMPDDLPAFEPAHEAVLFVWALLHASGGSLTRMDVARAFALRNQPAILRRFAPPELQVVADGWADRVWDRTVASGLLAKVLSDLAGRDGIRLATDGASRAVVVTSRYTPPEDKVDDWFRFEARLALGVLSALQPQHVQEIDQGITGDDRKLLAEGAE